jgi:ABC-2 type transport system ATP-binding protein
MSAENIIEIQSLSKSFKGGFEPALNEVNLTIAKNEVYGLLGPNGAGKTTLISIVCGVLKPTSGKVRLAGYDVIENSKEISQLIGVVPQDIALYPTLTAHENLGFYGAMYGLKGAEKNKKINYWLDKLGLMEAADRKVSTFSGGMKRRVNLIASVLHQPKILFLDEPTVGVDVQSRNVIIDHLKSLNQEGMTIIYTSHHMEEAENFCSKIAIIDYGSILTEGSPKQLIERTEGAIHLEDVFLKLTKRKLRD